ncbi:hypothetical protein [Arenicella xantha]|uniref:DUF2262 domain-containing protein n=1 Tax=Arenicella xantha TaxID=644221 RepID=A0A395JPZ5_9GAMM|nr:hypothetical protein [Arenicella xantha]RBP53587.1 hypothetical protein DFR28_101974 [Arenicella xantha]
MWKKLKEIILGKPSIEMEHEYFGKILFMGGDKPADDDYWEAEASIKEAKEPLTILINAPLSGPTEAHVAFYKNAVSDFEALFGKCWPIFEPDFQQWANKQFSGNWKDDFELMSIEIPRDADERNEWTVGYYVDAAKHYFTARFIDGKPTYNEIDG